MIPVRARLRPGHIGEDVTKCLGQTLAEQLIGEDVEAIALKIDVGQDIFLDSVGNVLAKLDRLAERLT